MLGPSRYTEKTSPRGAPKAYLDLAQHIAWEKSFLSQVENEIELRLQKQSSELYEGVSSEDLRALRSHEQSLLAQMEVEIANTPCRTAQVVRNEIKTLNNEFASLTMANSDSDEDTPESVRERRRLAERAKEIRDTLFALKHELAGASKPPRTTKR